MPCPVVQKNEVTTAVRPHQRPDGKVDVARQQHDELPEADERERARQQQRALHVVAAQEAAVVGLREHRHQHDQERQHDARQVVAGDEAPQALHAPGAQGSSP